MAYWGGSSASARPDGLESTNPFGNYTVVDLAPKEMLHMIDPHWYQYPPLNPMWYGILGFTIAVLGILSIVGNLIVIWVFMTTKALRSPANLLVVNLAISDFIMMGSNCPTMVMSCIKGTWAFSAFTCELAAFLANVAGCSAIYFMVFITLDRYNVIVKGVSGTPLTTTGALIRILFTWTFATCWCLAPFFGWNRYVPEGNLTACGTDYLCEDMLCQSYLLVYAPFVWATPLLIIIFCYFFIVKAVFAHEKQMREQAKKMGVKSLRNEESQKTSAECRLAKVALTTVSLWFIAWTPYMVINMTGIFNKPMISPIFTVWGSLFAKANAVYNPIIYAISHPKYRAALDKKLPCLACHGDSGGSDSNSQTTTQETEKTENA